ncbi:LysR family transcriptional regulator substrate-binding protein [Labedella populi]|nr:LysR family transcriptional regulator substrate-binding protein [Labedella populi]
MTGTHSSGSGALTVAFVRGVLPGKWQRIWNGRHAEAPLELVPTEQQSQLAPLLEGRADMAFVRLPLDAALPEDLLHVIPLYEEVTVVLASADHDVTAAEELTAEDIAGELIHPTDASLLETIEVVRAGVGLLVLPQSVARLAGGKGLEWRPLRDAAPSRIALAWPRPADDADDVLVRDLEDFVGVVRGRGENSSRGRSDDTAEDARAAEKRAADKRKADQRADKRKTGAGGRPRGARPATGRGRGSRNGRSGRR